MRSQLREASGVRRLVELRRQAGDHGLHLVGRVVAGVLQVGGALDLRAARHTLSSFLALPASIADATKKMLCL